MSRVIMINTNNEQSMLLFNGKTSALFFFFFFLDIMNIAGFAWGGRKGFTPLVTPSFFC